MRKERKSHRRGACRPRTRCSCVRRTPEDRHRVSNHSWLPVRDSTRMETTVQFCMFATASRDSLASRRHLGLEGTVLFDSEWKCALDTLALRSFGSPTTTSCACFNERKCTSTIPREVLQWMCIHLRWLLLETTNCESGTNVWSTFVSLLCQDPPDWDEFFPFAVGFRSFLVHRERSQELEVFASSQPLLFRLQFISPTTFQIVSQRVTRPWLSLPVMLGFKEIIQQLASSPVTKFVPFLFV